MSTMETDPKPLGPHDAELGNPLLDGEVDLPSIQDSFGSRLNKNAEIFDGLFTQIDSNGGILYHRQLLSPIDRRVSMWDARAKQAREMLMFGSNNYLGFANDPQVKERVIEAVKAHGVGMGGPMLLNGTSRLHRDLELRIAAFKGKEDCVLIPTGYMTNLAWITGLLSDEAVLLYDEVSHASVADGIRLGRKKAFRFNHNDCADLERQLARFREGAPDRDIFVSAQGVYSMNGELSPLPGIVELCERYRADLVVDDAHGTGVMGGGRGTAEHYGVAKKLRFAMGTFSKAFSVTGGFFAGDRKTVNLLRYFSRPYFFSAALPPTVCAAVLAGLDILETDPTRVERLHANADRLRAGLKDAGIAFLPTTSAIVPVFPPDSKHMREIAVALDRAGLFVNSIEAPGVPKGRERFRLTVMATHQPEDIDRAVEIFEGVFRRFR
jgi:8-amino-7-oxononanoate synthase